MQTITTFNEQNASSAEMETFTRILSTRAVILDNDENIAVIYSEQLHYYTLPGGCMDPGETPEQAIVRECKEETGCDVEMVSELGKVVEVRKDVAKIGEIFGYIVKLVGEKGVPEFMDDEIEEQFVIKWVTPAEAKAFFRFDIEHKETHQHIAKRALVFLDQAFPEA